MRLRIAGKALVSGLGQNLSEFTEGLARGDSAVEHDRLGYPVSQLPEGMPVDPVALARDVALEAWFDCGATQEQLQDVSTVLVVATTKGDIGGILGGDGEVALGTFLGRLRRALGHRGHAELVSCACASGAAALVRAKRLLEAGWGRWALVVGIDVLHDFLVHGFGALGALDAAPCRPYDETAAGMSLGEAAAAVVLDPAGGEGAWLVGCGLTCDAHTLLRPPEDGRGLHAAIRLALDEAGEGAVDAVNGHGTAMDASDRSEIEALQRGFPQHPPPLFGTKGAVGHTLGCAALLDAVVSAVALEDGLLPGTSSHSTAAAGAHVNTTARPADLRRVLSVNAGFGGANAALVFDRSSGPDLSASSRPVYLHGVAFLDEEHMGDGSGVRRWRREGDPIQPPARLFFDDVASFGRFDLASRYVLGAASLLPGVPDEIAARTGVILGSATGSLDVDQRFARTVGERPVGRLYARTLPSVPGAEVAIRLGLRGPNFALIQEGGAGVLALAAAAQEIALGGAEAMIAGGYEVVENRGRLRVVLAVLSSRPPRTGGYELHLDPARFGDGSGMMYVMERAQLEGAPTVEVTCVASGQPFRVRLQRCPGAGEEQRT